MSTTKDLVRAMEIQRNTLFPSAICNSILNEATNATILLEGELTDETLARNLNPFIDKYAAELLNARPHQNTKTYFQEDTFFPSVANNTGYMVTFKSKNPESLEHCKLNNIFTELTQLIADKKITSAYELYKTPYDKHPIFFEFSNQQGSYMDALDYYSDCQVIIDGIQEIEMSKGKTFHQVISEANNNVVRCCLVSEAIEGKDKKAKDDMVRLIGEHIITNKPIALSEETLVSSILDRERNIALNLATKTIEKNNKKENPRKMPDVEKLNAAFFADRMRKLILSEQFLTGHPDYYDVLRNDNEGKERITVGTFMKDNGIKIIDFIR